LPVKTRWFSNWTLLDAIKSNESCLKSAIWSPKIEENANTEKRKKNLKQLKKLLCEDTEFWSNLALIEELLRPLKSAILSIEGSIVDVSKAYKVVGAAFDKTSEIASKFPTEQVESINEVTI
jgi:hypothetical protein